MKTLHMKIFGIGLLWFLAGTSFASTISYDLSNLGGGSWEYTYTVTNDTMSSAIEEFTIYFGLGLYDNLDIPNPLTATWSELVAQPDASLPADGFYDALTLGSGILPGQMAGSFSVSFDWLGPGNPGAQSFDIVDPVTFNTLESGTTIPASTPPSSAVPEPMTLLLLGEGLLGFMVYRKIRMQA